MLSDIWNTLLIDPILNMLVGLYQLTGNMGISIILLTLLIRFILLPIVVPSMRSMKKQRDLQPQIDKLKKKYKNNRQKMAEAQMKLFKDNGLNPAAGCLTQIPMLVILIAVYGVIRRFSLVEDISQINASLYFDFLKITADSINTDFLYLNLGKADQFYILPILSGVAQFFASKLTVGFTKKAEKIAKKTPDKKDDLAYNVQEQMLYIMPVMTAIISISLPSGAVLYILTTTVFHLVQTYFIMGGKKQVKI